MDIDLETGDTEVLATWTERLPGLLEAARKRLAEDPDEEALLYARHHVEEVEPERLEARPPVLKAVNGLGSV